jgi:glutamine synthetase
VSLALSLLQTSYAGDASPAASPLRSLTSTQDSAVNPYLVQAALLATGLNGITAHAHPGPRSDANFHEERPPPGTRSLPSNLLDALRALSADEALRGALGNEVRCRGKG